MQHVNKQQHSAKTPPRRLIAAVSDNYIAVNITVQDIIDACCKQKLGKAMKHVDLITYTYQWKE